MRNIIFLLMTLLWVISCKPGTNGHSNSSGSEIEEMESRVMAVHDEVMPKMTEIGRLLNQLREMKTGFQVNEEDRLVVPDGFDKTVETLKLAEQGMWDWMKSYGDTKATLTEDQMKPFLEKELEKINKVKLDMLSSIESAQAWIAANSNQ